MNNTNINKYDPTEYLIEELKSIEYGRCFMICCLKRIKKSEIIMIPIIKNGDINGKSKERLGMNNNIS